MDRQVTSYVSSFRDITTAHPLVVGDYPISFHTFAATRSARVSAKPFIEEYFTLPFPTGCTRGAARRLLLEVNINSATHHNIKDSRVLFDLTHGH